MSFFYNEDYSDLAESDECEVAPLSLLELHTEMYTLGDKYQIPGLSKVAVKKYEGRLKGDWTPEEVLRSISRIYKLTPESNRALRQTALHHVRSAIAQFQSDDAIRIRFREMGRDIPEFMLDLLQIYIDEGKCKQCGPSQPIEPVQLECLNCTKGGARWEYNKNKW